MPLINCKVELSLKWHENCILSSAGTAATFAITDAKLDASFQRVNRLLQLIDGNNVTNENSYRTNFFPKFKMKNYNIKIDGRKFYDLSINDLIKRYDEVRKISTGQGDDYSTGCLLDFAYFEKNYRLIVVDLSKKKASDADPKEIQQTIFTGKTDNTIRVYYVLEQSKETILEFSKGTTKVL